MPRSFTEREREIIKDKLINQTLKLMPVYGIKTTVDQIASKANIAKGTFYLFYEKKELLFFDVFLKVHNDIHQELHKRLLHLKADCPDEITDLILNTYLQVQQSFLYKMMLNGELEILMRRLPKEVVDKHHQQDNLSIQNLLDKMTNLDNAKSEIYSGAFKAIFLSMIHKEEFGKADLADYLRVLIHGVVIQMLGDQND